MVVFTDGNFDNTGILSNALKQRGVEIIAIAVTKRSFAAVRQLSIASEQEYGDALYRLVELFGGGKNIYYCCRAEWMI